MIRREARLVRPAVTLVEILIVIAIIGVLVGLTVSAVGRFLVKGNEITAQNEILRMSDGLATFRQEFGVEYIPSKIVLREWHTPATMAQVQAGATLQDRQELATLNYLARMFGSRFNPMGPHDWTGRYGGPQNMTTVIKPPTQPITLEGQECLVFFLGGIPVVENGNTPQEKIVGVSGFATSVSSPTVFGGNRRGPFFDFKVARLIPSQEPRVNPTVTYGLSQGRFLVYIDPFNAEEKRPYLFFSSAKAGYNQWNTPDCGYLDLTTNPPTRRLYLPNGPYFQSANANGQPLRYHNHDGFQIISAGVDERYGTGGLLRPKDGSADRDTWDNKTNFSTSALGPGSWE